MTIFKNYNPWILEQDSCFISVNMPGTKLNCKHNFFLELGKKVHISQSRW